MEVLVPKLKGSNFSVRSLWRDNNDSIQNHKGKKPEWLSGCWNEATLLVKQRRLKKLLFEVTAGNSQGNHTAKISISINPKPIVEVDEDDEEQTTKPAEEIDDKSGGEDFPLPPSSLDIAISEIRRDTTNCYRKRMLTKRYRC